MPKSTIFPVPELVWSGKHAPGFNNGVSAEDISRLEVHGNPPEGGNRLYLGDNLPILLHLRGEYGGSVDLIYIDPPFDSSAEYRKKVFLKTGTQPIRITESPQYSDIWSGCGYLQFIYERLLAAKLLLKPGGNMVLHCDWHRSHHLRCLMDEVFGPENFRNEIVYCYSGGGIPRSEMPKKHDVLLWYSNGAGWTYNAQYRSYSEGTLKRGRTAVKGGHARLREQGTPVNDWWTDIKKITSPTDPEKLYYPTQKSEALLERIINMLSDPGGLVLDFFMGSGTAPAAAAKLGRRFLGIDQNPAAVQTAVNRLARMLGEAERCRETFPGFEVFCAGGGEGRAQMGGCQPADGHLDAQIDAGELRITAFCSPRLKAIMDAQQLRAEDWRQTAEAVFIDWDCDGEVFRPSAADIPARRGLVSGVYPVPQGAGRIRIKAVDLLMGAQTCELCVPGSEQRGPAFPDPMKIQAKKEGIENEGTDD